MTTDFTSVTSVLTKYLPPYFGYTLQRIQYLHSSLCIFIALDSIESTIVNTHANLCNCVPKKIDYAKLSP